MSVSLDDIVIAGIGQIPVGEHWELSLRNIAAQAMLAAIKDSGGIKPQAIYVGNLLASVISGQANLGALMAECIAMEGVEAFTAESGEASGAAALHLAYWAVLSGYVEYALVIGVEKFTDVVGYEMESAIAQSMDYDFEGVQGMTATSAAALLMQRYLYEYQPPRDVFGQLAIIAHANAVNNPNALFRKAITLQDYQRAGMVCDPLNLYDVAPYADGAAAALITHRDLLPTDYPYPVVKIAASTLVTDALSLHDRTNPLAFEAVRLSAQRALSKAGLEPNQIDLFEYWDAFSIYSVMQLEAAGFAAPGEGWKLAQNDALILTGQLPVATLGGLKARGFPLGATGLYQIADAVTQLRGAAEQNQVRDAKTALVQSLGGAAATVVTHILRT